jgi:hypothetical protein
MIMTMIMAIIMITINAMMMMTTILVYDKQPFKDWSLSKLQA